MVRKATPLIQKVKDLHLVEIFDFLSMFFLAPYQITSRYRWFAMALFCAFVSFAIRWLSTPNSFNKTEKTFFGLMTFSMLICLPLKNMFHIGYFIKLLFLILTFYNFKEIIRGSCRERSLFFTALSPIMIYILGSYLLQENPNTIFAASSRNTISIYYIYTLLLFAFLFLKNLPQPFTIFLSASFIGLSLNIWAGGRMGIICAAGILIFFLIGFIFSAERKKKKNIFIVLLALICSMSLIYRDQTAVSYVSKRFENERIVERHRLSVVLDVLKNTSPSDYLFGRIECEKCSLSYLEYNFHNSYLKILSSFGLVFSLLFSFFIVSSLRNFKRSPILLVLFLFLLTRALTDEIFFFQPFDLVFTLVLLKSSNFMNSRAPDRADA